jgi:tetratricopeptide (TPR) repeat protein
LVKFLSDRRALGKPLGAVANFSGRPKNCTCGPLLHWQRAIGWERPCGAHLDRAWRPVVGFRTFSDQSPAPTPATSTAYKRGLAALGEDDLDAAIREFTAAIADDPNDVFPYIKRAAAYEKKGDAASAIGDYRKVLKLVDADTGAEYAAKIRKLEKTKK